jgi:hypothetical protein
MAAPKVHTQKFTESQAFMSVDIVRSIDGADRYFTVKVDFNKFVTSHGAKAMRSKGGVSSDAGGAITIEYTGV